MRDHSELERLRAAARIEAGWGNPLLRALRSFALIASGIVLYIALRFRHIDWSNRLLDQRLGAFVLAALGVLFLAMMAAEWQQYLAMGGGAVAGEIELERVQRWVQRLSSPQAKQLCRAEWRTQYQTASVLLGAFRWWTDRSNEIRTLVRVMVDEHWIVVGVYADEELSRLSQLRVFDATTEQFVYDPEKKWLRIGSYKINMVPFTPELAELAKQAGKFLVSA